MSVDTDLEGMRTGVEGWGERDELLGIDWDIFSEGSLCDGSSEHHVCWPLVSGGNESRMCGDGARGGSSVKSEQLHSDVLGRLSDDVDAVRGGARKRLDPCTGGFP